MQTRQGSRLRRTIIILFISVFIFGRFHHSDIVHAEKLPLQIESQVFYDLTFTNLLRNHTSARLETILSEANKLLYQSSGIRLKLNPYPIQIPESLATENGSKEMEKFRAIVNMHNIASDVNILITAPRNNSGALGLSYQNSLCSGTEHNLIIVRMNSPIYSAFTLVHELAHLIGAQHDSSSQNYIMQNKISYPIPKNFSQSSLHEMTNLIHNKGACLLSSENQPIKVKRNHNNFGLNWGKLKTKRSFCLLTAAEVLNLPGTALKMVKKFRISTKLRRKKLAIKNNSITDNLYWSLRCGHKLKTSKINF